MMMKMILAIGCLFIALSLNAQDKIPVTEEDYTNHKVEMADVMRSNGKIYVVVAIIASIFVGILYYLWTTDRKIAKLEREIGQHK